MSLQERLKLYLQHRTELINYAYALLNRREQAEDVVQDVWLKFERQSLEAVRQPSGYLFRMVRNLAMDELRDQRLQQRYNASLEHDPREHADPASLASRRIALERLQHALAELDEDCRLAFEMHRFAGLTLQQIAANLGLSPSTAHRHVQQAMRHCLNAVYGSDEHA